MTHVPIPFCYYATGQAVEVNLGSGKWQSGFFFVRHTPNPTLVLVRDSKGEHHYLARGCVREAHGST
jgi:hypothetical protein